MNAELTGNMPASAAGYDYPALQARSYPADLLQLFQDSVDAAAPRTATPYWSDISSAIQSTWHHRGSSSRTHRRSRRRSSRKSSMERSCYEPRRLQPPATNEAPAPASDRSVAENRLGQKLVAPAVILMLLVTAWPMLQALYLSLFRYRLTAPDDREFVGPRATTSRS